MASKKELERALELAVKNISTSCQNHCPLHSGCIRRGDTCEADIKAHYLKKAQVKGKNNA